MKRTLSLILALFMLAALAPMSIMAATSFKDVKSTDYYSVAAGKLSEDGILKGYPDGTFGPARAITRAEMAAIVCRMTGIDTSNKENIKSVFTDVADNHWAIAEIYAASEKKIINGDGDGTFRPEDDVKHEEAIKMVVCALGLVGDDIKIDPVDWSAAYLKIADENGITEKLVGTKGAKSTRGDVAVMVYNGIASNVKMPTASVKAGTYSSSQKVELKSDIEGAQIFYTINGDTPTEKSTLYTKAITISKTCTLKAIAVLDGVSSRVLVLEYKIKSESGSSGTSSGSSSDDDTSYDDNYGGSDSSDTDEPTVPSIKVSKPASSLKSGRYTIAKSTTLTTETEGAEFYYTLDGSNPTVESTKYEDEIIISETCTLKAIAVVQGVSSPVLSVEYTIEQDEESSAICTDLSNTLVDIESVFEILELDRDPEFNEDPVNVGVTEKTIEILEYVKKDINLTLEAAAEGIVISNSYVRSTYVEDIVAVRTIIDEMTDEEFDIFINEKMNYLNVATLNALIEHFNINKDYRK